MKSSISQRSQIDKNMRSPRKRIRDTNRELFFSFFFFSLFEFKLIAGEYVNRWNDLREEEKEGRGFKCWPSGNESSVVAQFGYHSVCVLKYVKREIAMVCECTLTWTARTPVKKEMSACLKCTIVWALYVVYYQRLTVFLAISAMINMYNAGGLCYYT